jgi:hypothetical protein
VTRPRVRPRHTWRLTLCAALIGLVGYALVGAWEGFPPEVTSVEHLMFATSFALAVLLLFRRFLASMPWTAALPVAVLGLFLVALSLMVVGTLMTCLAGETIQEEGESFGEALGIAVIWGTISVLITAVQFFYVSLPISWISVLLLRWASGGIEGDASGVVRADELRARRTGLRPSRS